MGEIDSQVRDGDNDVRISRCEIPARFRLNAFQSPLQRIEGIIRRAVQMLSATFLDAFRQPARMANPSRLRPFNVRALLKELQRFPRALFIRETKTQNLSEFPRIKITLPYRQRARCFETCLLQLGRKQTCRVKSRRQHMEFHNYFTPRLRNDLRFRQRRCKNSLRAY